MSEYERNPSGTDPDGGQEDHVENGAESREEIVARLKAKISQVYEGPQAMAAMEKVAMFADRLKARYPDYSSYRLYHVLAFSGQAPDAAFTRFDFPGDDSIRSCIEGLE